MIEIIKIIALLCKVSSGVDNVSMVDYIEKNQLKCQKYYIKCVDLSNSTSFRQLKKCILEKK